jgi:Fur family transcriptional regulator, ferric uptake regulator
MKKSRQTRQRELIQELVDKMNVFFSAEDLFRLAKRRDPKIGVATIYRFLTDLKKRNKIHTYTCDRRTLFSKEKISHCHYVCEKTGKITHFDIDSLDFLKQIKDKIPGTISSVSLEIRGTCENCSK